LIRDKTVGPLQDFRSKMGRPFAAILKLSPEFKVEFDFGQNGTDANGNAEAVDFSGKEPLGACPKCGANVFENGMSYVCEKGVGPNRTCTFRSGTIILQQPVDRAQMSRLLATRKTELLPKFISKKGRPFGAYLIVDQDGKVTFEFEKRTGKPSSAARPARRSRESPAPDQQRTFFVVQSVRRDRAQTGLRTRKPPCPLPLLCQPVREAGTMGVG
jgi:DNA topoisomerase-3